MKISNQLLIVLLGSALTLVTSTGCADERQDQQQPKVTASEVKKAPLRKVEKTEQDPVMRDNTPPVDQLSKGELKAAWYVGKLRYYALEGGFYGFHGETGERLLLIGLDKSLLQDGAKIKVYGYPAKNMMTIEQWGQPFKVLKAELLEAGKNAHNPNL
ncbi:hypothetical protein QWY77_12965 [Thalassotalea ponticola]|uniref:hypothetical protein n=1 Tax=Thalassotalea ponticola TaxID=1523392 RepID=UPI0025B35783|nr:hypothetical protein [Thalassotalea ponticola]MDN3653648.1 hypothetical protein [Thalassotalea ponticola]